jgi:Uri superfamily endonuclease
MGKHAMKRLDVGHYQYRGHVIDRVSRFDNDKKFSHWQILDESDHLVEAATTLKECRYWIDRMCNDKGEA